MAKQSGLHQIKGKVGEHSYYRQTGVSGGLIRSINQGLSERVKTDQAYANTRLNNVEFGGACNVAGLLGGIVMPKFRPMILPFSQSNMAKRILEIVKSQSGDWGKRSVSSSDTARLADILSATSKRNVHEFVTVEVEDDGNGEVLCKWSWTSEQATLMSSLGITDVQIVFTQFDVATGKFSAVEGKIHNGYTRARGSQVFVQEVEAGADDFGTERIETSVFAPTPELYNPHQFFVAVVLPIRKINNVSHVLQEYCSFVAMESPATFD